MEPLPETILHRNPPLTIGIAGGSGAGKTTVTDEVIEAAGADAVLIVELDSYYCDLHHLSFDERAAQNFDHPDAFEWSLLLDQLSALRRGESVDMPEYDFTTHLRKPETRRVDPRPVIVVDGILALYEPALRDQCDLKVFVDVDADLRFIRRLRRDVAERGRTADNVIDHYLDTVRPMHETFVEPTKRHADVIIPHGGRNPAALNLIAALLRETATQQA